MLATLLAQPETQRETVVHALKVFDEIRRPFAQHVQDMSLEAGKVIFLGNARMQSYTAEDSAAGKIPHDQLTELIAQDAKQLQQWTWTATVTKDLQFAIDQLKAQATAPS
jgi:salicylate hydroxylase